jgi:hypothetical protein
VAVFEEKAVREVVSEERDARRNGHLTIELMSTYPIGA